MAVAEKINDRIIRRVKGLLALAEDNSNIAESQSAFVRAQAMMIEHGIDSSEITDDDEVKKVLEKNGTDYKRLAWWERRLAQITSKNFRCKYFYRYKRMKGKKQRQSRIEFMGLENDVELASQMYRLVIEATIFYSNRYVKQNNIQGDRGYTIAMKDTYIRGFLTGLEEKFERQVTNNEWGLVLVIPEHVLERYSEVVTGGLANPFKIPKIEDEAAYYRGFEEGNAIDYQRGTINDDVIK